MLQYRKICLARMEALNNASPHRKNLIKVTYYVETKKKTSWLTDSQG